MSIIRPWQMRYCYVLVCLRTYMCACMYVLTYTHPVCLYCADRLSGLHLSFKFLPTFFFSSYLPPSLPSILPSIIAPLFFCLFQLLLIRWFDYGSYSSHVSVPLLLILFSYFNILFYEYIQLKRLPVMIPSESNFLTISTAIEILHEFDNIFSTSNTRIQHESALLLKRNCMELIEKCSNPCLKIRSVANSGYSTELHLWLLQSMKKSLENLEELFRDVAPHALAATAILNSG